MPHLRFLSSLLIRWYSVDENGDPDPSAIVPHFVDFAKVRALGWVYAK